MWFYYCSKLEEGNNLEEAPRSQSACPWLRMLNCRWSSSLNKEPAKFTGNRALMLPSTRNKYNNHFQCSLSPQTEVPMSTDRATGSTIPPYIYFSFPFPQPFKTTPTWSLTTTRVGRQYNIHKHSITNVGNQIMSYISCRSP